MGFEPEVEKTIAGYRRRTIMRKAAVLTPVVMTVVVFIVILVITLVLPPPAGTPDDSFFYGVFFRIFIPAIVLLAQFFLVYQYAILKPIMEQFRFRSKGVGGENKHRYQLFAESLEGAAIAAGIPPPPLEVVMLATANSFTFEVGGKQIVGITPGMLDADLTQHEVEAVMAHETAHIATLTSLKAPLVLQPWTTLLIGGLAILLPVITAIVTGNVLFVIPILFVPVIPIWWLTTVVMPYLPWKRLAYYEAEMHESNEYWLRSISVGIIGTREKSHDENLLADAIAVKITSNPQALKSAIIKLRALMESAAAMPTQTITFPYLFIGPLKGWDAPKPTGIAYYTRGLFIPGGIPMPTEDLVKEEKAAFIKLQNELLDERILNLDVIDKGIWQEFQEVRGGKVHTSSKAWE